MKLSERINLFTRTADEMEKAIAETEAIIPDGYKYITDRLSITVGEIRNVCESLTQHGELDEELVDAMDNIIGEY